MCVCVYVCVRVCACVCVCVCVCVCARFKFDQEDREAFMSAVRSLVVGSRVTILSFTLTTVHGHRRADSQTLNVRPPLPHSALRAGWPEVMGQRRRARVCARAFACVYVYSVACVRGYVRVRVRVCEASADFSCYSR